MSEECCEYCGRAVPYDEIEYGWCPECIDEVTHDTELMLKYICDYRNRILKSNLEHDFFVNYCHNANDTEFSRELMLVCKEHILYEIRTGNAQTIQLLTAYMNEDLSTYLEWVQKRDKAEQITKRQQFDSAVREAINAICLNTQSSAQLDAAIKQAIERIKENQHA